MKLTITELRNYVQQVLSEDTIKVYHKGKIESIIGHFQIGDRVMTYDLPKGSPYSDREGVVVHSQPDDVRVKLDGMTDEHGEGFLPNNLIKIPPQKFRVLTPEEKKQMMFDAITMSEAGWMKKYPVGDYGDYREMGNRLLGNKGIEFGNINMNEEGTITLPVI